MYKYLQYFINFLYTFIFIASLYVCMYDIYVKHKYICILKDLTAYIYTYT